MTALITTFNEGACGCLSGLSARKRRTDSTRRHAQNEREQRREDDQNVEDVERGFEVRPELPYSPNVHLRRHLAVKSIVNNTLTMKTPRTFRFPRAGTCALRREHAVAHADGEEDQNVELRATTRHQQPQVSALQPQKSVAAGSSPRVLAISPTALHLLHPIRSKRPNF